MRWALLIGLMFALIIIPFLIFEKQFEALGTWLAEGHASGWASASIIAALLALDVFLPVPSSIVSTGAGVLLGFWRGAAVIWIGMTVGCAIGYAFGAEGIADRTSDRHPDPDHCCAAPEAKQHARAGGNDAGGNRQEDVQREERRDDRRRGPPRCMPFGEPRAERLELFFKDQKRNDDQREHQPDQQRPPHHQGLPNRQHVFFVLVDAVHP